MEITIRMGRAGPPTRIEQRSCRYCGRPFLAALGNSRFTWLAKPHVQCCTVACGQRGKVYASNALDMPIDRAAWLAGIVDGEGTLLAIYPKRATVPTSRPQMRLVVVNTHLPMLERCVEWTGYGCIKRHTSKPTNYSATPKPCFVWQVNGASAMDIMEQIEPWLMAKAERARLLISSRGWTYEKEVANAAARGVLPAPLTDFDGPRTIADLEAMIASGVLSTS